jgi:hypothetical protein
MELPTSCVICNCAVQPIASEWAKHENGKSHKKKAALINSTFSVFLSLTPDHDHQSVSLPSVSSSTSSSSSCSCRDDVCLPSSASCSSPRSNPRTSHSLTHNVNSYYHTRESQAYSEASNPSRSYSHARAAAAESQPSSSTSSSHNDSVNSDQSFINPSVTVSTTPLPNADTDSVHYRALSPLSAEFNPILDLPPRHFIDSQRIMKLTWKNPDGSIVNGAHDVVRLLDAAYHTLHDFTSINASFVTFDAADYPPSFDYTAYAFLVAMCFQNDYEHVIFTLHHLKSLPSFSTISSSSPATAASSSSCAGLIAPCRMFDLYRPCRHSPFYCPVCDVDLYGKRDFVVHLQHSKHAAAMRAWNEREARAAARYKSDTLNARFSALLHDTPMPADNITTQRPRMLIGISRIAIWVEGTLDVQICTTLPIDTMNGMR